jgi:hypothetical protein
VLCSILHGVGDVQLTVQRYDAKGYKAAWHGRVNEPALHIGWLGEGAIKHVDLIVM